MSGQDTNYWNSLLSSLLEIALATFTKQVATVAIVVLTISLGSRLFAETENADRKRLDRPNIVMILADDMWS